jgi:hypothetical protein
MRHVSAPAGDDVLARKHCHPTGRLSESERAMSTHHITSVTADSDFAYVQFDCGHVTVKRDGNRIILTPGPDCELASRGNLNMVEVTVSKITQRPQPRSWAWPARSRK